MVVNLSVSCFKTAMFEVHGKYKSENMSKEIALAFVKHTTLVLKTKLSISVALFDALLQIERVETISSFAIIPTISAQTMPELFNPIGANKNEILLLTKNKILSPIFCVYLKVKSVWVSNHTIIFTLTITPVKRFNISTAFVLLTWIICLKSIFRIGGNSSNIEFDFDFKIVLFKMDPKINATINPKIYNPAIIK